MPKRCNSGDRQGCTPIPTWAPYGKSRNISPIYPYNNVGVYGLLLVIIPKNPENIFAQKKYHGSTRTWTGYTQGTLLTITISTGFPVFRQGPSYKLQQGGPPTSYKWSYDPYK